ncbi:MAG: class II aldolase/adducin family protein [Clostridiaceae bacterium]
MLNLDFKTYEAKLKDLEYISKEVGIPVEYTQGGGGNTSVKLDGEFMAVKASGCKLKQITPSEGYVIIDYKKIKDYYSGVDLNADHDFEKESAELARQSVQPAPWLKVLRPSVEAGFHSIMKKYVIHTHSVYANILTCAENGQELVNRIFGGKAYKAVWIPYINPGFCLTLKIRESIRECRERNGKEPEVFFMENHGLIVTADEYDRTVNLHSEVNDAIRDYLDITQRFPEIVLLNVDENTTISRTAYISEFIKNDSLKPGFFEEVILYPDQFVYLNDAVAFNSLDKKLNIMTDTGEVIYKTGGNEARVMEETLLACVYVVNEMKRRSLPLKTMTKKDIDFIKNWESEAYRKSLVKEMKR